MINNTFQKIYKQIILEQTADLTNEIIPLIQKDLNNNILSAIKEKDETLYKKIKRYKKFKKSTLLNQLSEYITNDCECKEDILEILKNQDSADNSKNDQKDTSTNLSLEQIDEILKEISQNEKCLALADEAFGEDYMNNIVKQYTDNKEQACNQFKNMLLDKDPEHQKACKKFLKQFNKETEGSFTKVCKSIFSFL